MINDEKYICKKSSKSFYTKLLIKALFFLVIAIILVLCKANDTAYSIFIVVFLLVILVNLNGPLYLKNLKKYLFNKYSNININKFDKIEILVGDKSKCGNIRRRNTFSFSVNDYGCTVYTYYYEILTQDVFTNNNSIHISYSYKKMSQAVEYRYMVNKNISELSDIFKSDEVVDLILELDSKIEFDYELYDNLVVFRKMTCYSNFKNDIDDIELFYNCFIKRIN